NVAHGTINRAVVRSYLVIAVPFTVLGTLLVPFAPVTLLIGVFGVAIILYGIYRVYRFGLPGSAVEPCNPGGPEGIDRFLAAIGGFLQGLIATGVGMIVGPCLLRDGRIRAPAEAVGSTVAVVFVATLVATALRLTPDFIPVLASQGDRIVDIMIWVAPGVVVGGQLGPFLAKRLSARGIRVYVGVLMVFIGILICLRALSGS
ncbi:MAG TPA: sulfite exporter TauE/SafE family protein, partial [Methanomicrobiales archaeon]|nr:sulfite exporter TauE/SafE family protein [Methanomicrobiales archaeon]